MFQAGIFGRPIFSVVKDVISKLRISDCIMKKKYVYFRLVEQKPKTLVVGIHSISTDEKLGTIKWHPAWRQYVFQFEEGTIWSDGCIQQIINFKDKISELREVDNTEYTERRDRLRIEINNELGEGDND